MKKRPTPPLPTDRGYLTKTELDVLMKKPMPSARLERVRDLFVFSCFCGLAYKNIRTTQIYARITKTRISDDMNALARRLDGGKRAVAV